MPKKVEDVRDLVVWSRKKLDIKFPRNAKVSYADPRHFYGKQSIRPKYDAVYAPDCPHIEEAFEETGVLVYRPDGKTEKKIEKTKEPEKELTAEEVDELADTSWKSLPAAQLKKEAAKYTDEDVKNKEVAISVLEKAEEEGKFKSSDI